MSKQQVTIEEVKEDLRYLRLLARDFPTVTSVTTEIINLEAILHLPKPTEHFLADLHGEHEAFRHILRNASGNIKRKVNELFAGSISDEEKKELCTLIYYPEEKLKLVRQTGTNLNEYYSTMLNRLIVVCRNVSSKYTRSKVRKALPEEYAYIIEELMHEANDFHNRQAYLSVIVQTIIGTGRAEHFITAICYLIQRLVIDRLHILGDIFDRGPGAHHIMDALCDYHHLDITWGNHDVLWMGAAAGNTCCIASVLRLSLRDANTTTLEDGYAINMVPLATFAMEQYTDDPCTIYLPRVDEERTNFTDKDIRLIAQMHKAVSVIEFKLSGQIAMQHPEWNMHDRCLMEFIDKEKGTIKIDGKEYEMKDKLWPTLDTDNPYALTPEEQDVMERLRHSFMRSERLQSHVNCLLMRGGMYAIYNSNLMFHAAVPINEDGSMREVIFDGTPVKGKELMKKVEHIARSAFDNDVDEKTRNYSADFFWYLWCGPESPLFGKQKMATFERYLLTDKEVQKEPKGWYYILRDNPQICDRILDEFGVKGEHRHIINGHVPVRVGKGETPIKADGRLMVIDGGFSRVYHNRTGIAGYTLVYHSKGFELVQHEPFTSTEEAILNGTDIHGTTQIVEMMGRREMVRDTDIGRGIMIKISDLERLLAAYRKGIIKERP
ncbi:MAG: fructose-1,6-bisphosphatase [Bacteroidaceae bacterium]|nr:fructose-1,6-bisphosphatase [Bacteroidaceae bacterium]MBQ3539835.1 fructose-1,6-bisphosphatase [Bacteroidaceae bacterium]MBQ6694662.1 fructose-1,6-bisphosphatase [Bacteroidaceae bacterium]MBR7166952.1 fructose-1,6-bisphosphatase [Bacteroidaceae bacterium]